MTLPLLLALVASPAAPDVVLVGNNPTQRADLPVLLRRTLEATAPGSTPEITVLAAQARTWTDHVDLLDTPAYDALDGPLDVVVLQEQSPIPAYVLTSPARLASAQAAQTLHAAADEAGAATLLFQTWAERDGNAGDPERLPDFPGMQDQLTYGYDQYVDALSRTGPDAFLAPVGEAWRVLYDDDPTEDGAWSDLFAEGGVQASPSGAALTAAVLAASITGRRPLLPDDVLDAEQRGTLEAIATALVLDDPEAWPQAWWIPLDRWRLDHPDGRVQGGWQRPAVWVASALDGTLALDDARLWVKAPAVLDLDTLEATSATAVVTGGTLEADTAALGDTTVDARGGALDLTGLSCAGDVALFVRGSAEVTLGEVACDDGPLAIVQDGGELVLTGGAVAALQQSQGRWLTDGTAPVRFAATPSLGGTLELTAPVSVGAPIRVAEAPSFGLLPTLVPGDLELSVVATSGGEALEVVRTPIASGPDTSPPPEACGCATSPTGSWLLVPFGLLACRRRRPC